VSSDGANLVREVSNRSRTVAGAQVDPLGDDQFLRMQRIGHFGAQTLDLIMGSTLGAATTKTAATTALTLAYRWWTALRDHQQPAAA
jgi:hypothetical protein